MSELPGAREPLLAICIPTFNRASRLRNLFRSVGAVKSRFGEEVEVCISNNCSTDDTRAVVEEFARQYQIVAHHQPSNVGATLNIIAVAGLMRSRWGIWCGDDDEIDPDAIGRILARLRKLVPETWVLVDSAGANGHGQYLRHFADGPCDAARFRRSILRSGLDPFGFMGVHVFPRSAVPLLHSVHAEHVRPWPPIACMLQFLVRPGARVETIRDSAIRQATGGAALFWLAGDLARVYISRVRVLGHVNAAVSGHHAFIRLLMFRELYSRTNLVLLLAWKLYEPEDFCNRAPASYAESWRWTGAWSPLTIPHVLIAAAAYVSPHALLALLLRLSGRGHFLKRYASRKLELQSFDGIKRGM